MRTLTWAVCLLAGGCVVDLELPPPPGPASLSGTLVYAIPGKTQLAPAKGASVEVQNSSLRAVANDEGFFQLDKLSAQSGTLVFRFDLNGDGKPDRQKNVDLAALGLRPGRDLNLGQVVLGRNASVVGRALRADRSGAPSGHGGSTVFVPEGPYAAITGDDGSFSLPELPEGPLTLAVFRPGFEVGALELVLRSGEELRAPDLTLAVSTAPPAKATLEGKVVLTPEPQDSAPVQVTLYLAGAAAGTAPASGDGAFHFENVDVGLYDLTAVRAGYRSSLTRNVFLQAGANRLGDVVLVPGESSVPDAGALVPADAGQVTQVDRLMDGGVDPGPPAALVSPQSQSVRPDAGQVQFSGEFSVGQQPLRYQWSVLIDAGASIPLTVGSPFSPAVSAGLPPPGALAVVSLVVTDPQGRVSPPATGQVLVSEPPVAKVTPPGPLTLPPSLTLSGASSADPLGLGLRYAWTVDFGGLSLSSFNAPSVLVTGTSVGPARVTLRVTNAFGLESPPTSVDLYVTLAGNDFSVDAGAPQTVDGGTLIFLSGSLVANAPVDQFDLEWSERTFFGNPLTLNNKNALTANVFLPTFFGQDQTRSFVFKAARPKGCGFNPTAACEVREAEAKVTVVDADPPTANFFGSSEVTRFGPLKVNLNEPISAGSVTSSSVRWVDLSTGTDLAVTRKYDASRSELSLEFLSPLVSGNSYRLVLDGLEDLSSRKNKMATTSHDYLARGLRSGQSYRSQGAGSPMLSPTPGVGLQRVTNQGNLTDERAFVVARKDSPDNQWFFAPVTTFSSPGQLAEQSTLALANRAMPGRRVHSAAGRLFALGARASGAQWSTVSDGVLSTYDATTNLWQQLPRGAGASAKLAAPGPLFSDGSLLYALVARSGLRAVRLDTSGAPAGWGFPDATNTPLVEVVDATAAFGTDSPGLVAGGTVFAGVRTVAAFEPSNGGRLHVYRSSAQGSWQALSDADADLSLGATVFPVDVRVAATADAVVVGAMIAVGGTPQVRTLVCRLPGCDWTPVTTASGVHDGFDLDVRGPAAVLALPVSGSLRLFTLDLSSPTPSWVQESGLWPDGSYNDDTSCFAEAPEMVRGELATWLTWGEKCATAPWQVVLRRVD